MTISPIQKVSPMQINPYSAQQVPGVAGGGGLLSSITGGAGAAQGVAGGGLPGLGGGAPAGDGSVGLLDGVLKKALMGGMAGAGIGFIPFIPGGPILGGLIGAAAGAGLGLFMNYRKMKSIEAENQAILGQLGLPPGTPGAEMLKSGDLTPIQQAAMMPGQEGADAGLPPSTLPGDPAAAAADPNAAPQLSAMERANMQQAQLVNDGLSAPLSRDELIMQALEKPGLVMVDGGTGMPDLGPSQAAAAAAPTSATPPAVPGTGPNGGLSAPPGPPPSAPPPMVDPTSAPPATEPGQSPVAPKQAAAATGAGTAPAAPAPVQNPAQLGAGQLGPVQGTPMQNPAQQGVLVSTPKQGGVAPMDDSCDMPADACDMSGESKADSKEADDKRAAKKAKQEELETEAREQRVENDVLARQASEKRALGKQIQQRVEVLRAQWDAATPEQRTQLIKQLENEHVQAQTAVAQLEQQHALELQAVQAPALQTV